MVPVHHREHHERVNAIVVRHGGVVHHNTQALDLAVPVEGPVSADGTGYVHGGRFADVAAELPYRQMPAATGPARFIGSDKDRQGVGDPGHCEACVSVGHVAAHPELGCGDVGCNDHHDEQAGTR
jgi:hypothetical protein